MNKIKPNHLETFRVNPKLEKKIIYAVREAGTSQHYVGQSNGPPETPQYDIAVTVRRVSEGLQLGPHDAESF